MKTRKLQSWLVLLASFVMVLQLSNIARAQDQDQGQNQGQYDQGQQSPDQGDYQDQGQDPPGRVGRLDFSQGSVSFRPAGEDDWVTAVPNRPMVNGDDLWSDQNSRAEVHIGSTAIRMGERTGITFLALDDRNTQIRLAQGSLILRVRHLDDDDNYEVDTPNLAFTLLQPGEYRLSVSDDGSRTNIVVWHGRGRATGGGYTYNVVADQYATFTGDGDHLDYDLGQIPRSDDFDSWAFDRDGREDRADSANYVSREMTGYEDLDEYGDWSYVSGYGPCWRPRGIVAGWAPYRYGHWIYVSPWGWTWVEDEPWGYAPFHYGRWAYEGGGWFWVPGPVVVRPVWSPAFVAFVGGGPSFSVGVGWFPLAPGEVWVPAYHVSRGYVNNVNITNTTVNVTKVTNVYNTVIVNKSTTINNVTYVNRNVTNAVTVVNHDTFVNARPVARNMERVDQRQLASAPVARAVAAEPVRTSVVGPGRPVQNRPPAAVMQRKVVAVRTPPPPPRPIEQRQAQAGGHLNEQALVRPAGPARPAPTSPARPAENAGRPAAENPRPGNENAARPGNENASRPGNENGARPGNENTARPGNENASRPAPEAPARPGNENASRPAPETSARPERQPAQEGGFRPFTPPNSGQARPAPQNETRPGEARGTASPAPPPQNRLEQTNQGYRESQRGESGPPQESHPLVRQPPPVQQRTPEQEQQQAQKFNQWRQQRPSPPPPQRQESRPSPPPAKDKPKH